MVVGIPHLHHPMPLHGSIGEIRDDGQLKDKDGLTLTLS